MTSFRQIEGNRHNAIRSTGPNTEEGKQRSRRNAIRHGLCAETVIEIVEDIEDYRAFEAAVIGDYDAQTAVERELVLRLASLLWRLRRATSIETDLLRIQAEILRERRECRSNDQLATYATRLHVLEPPGRRNGPANSWNSNGLPDDESCGPISALTPPRDLAHCFQRLANLDNGVFERLGRYETALWRQMAQTLFLLQPARRR